ncbi:hypothetical protein EJ06DRAFT_473988 [Trichodelitschia bisporula]|uniref:TPR-like protein n=1 Tax=Trichodelitschia bisporula TaxID=703511 RepID=A0A6G1I253_9PEZI|nr:hypothetical protein EJ06DRAFT_473988 [Trichodelitschia bisporula]
MDKAKHWYTKATASGSSVSAADIDSIFQACLTHKDPEWGWAIIREVTENGRLKEDRDLWDSLFVWSAHNGKSVDEVDRMMEVMGRTNKTFRPRNQTINSLIAVANARNDSYLAERFLSLGLKWGVKPDALTYLYQIDYRLSVGDVDGAQQAYNQLQGQEVESGEDVPRINRLLQAVCATPKPSFERVMKIVDDLSERHARFEPDTVSALSVLHLKRDEYHDVVDLLQTHVGNYSWEERAKVRDVFVNFCLDRRNPIARVWDTYMIFHQIFDETDRKVRTRIMNEFFTRRRADMAVHVFNHMRQHIRPDTVATLDTYVTALVGIGRLGDAESLDLIHNQLKLDLHVDPNTRLYNALMIGYTGCNDASRAMEFWDDIAGSQEGPTTNSILVMFRACEMASFGEVKAQAIWRQLNELDAEITKEMATEYIGALAGNLMLDEAYNMVQNKLEQEYGFKPDVKILGTLFNATRSRSRQPGVGTWIQSNFPEIWKELEALGSKKNLNDTRNFRIDRTLEP